MKPIRVAAVLTHPVQYSAAWFRWIAANCSELDLHVIYASRPTADQQGVVFGKPFEWNVPLTEGYQHAIVRESRPNDRFDAGSFRGLDVPEVADAVRDVRPDVVVVFGWYSATLVRAIRTARDLGIPVIYYGDTNLHSGVMGWRRLLWLVRTKRMLRLFDGYLSVGIRSAAFLRFFDIPDERIFASPHAVDNDRFAQACVLRRSAIRAEIRREHDLPRDAFVVLSVGKLEPKKRPLDIIAAVAAMRPRPHLAFVGSGEMYVDIRRAAAAAGVPLTMIGFVNQAELPRVFAAADCLVLASDARETWGLVVNEALAGGLPCVVADSAGCAPDLVNDETGAQYATADPYYVPERLSGAISRVRDRIASGHDYAPACAERVSRYSFAAATAGLVRACQAMVASWPVGQAKTVRVIALCGGMVQVSGLERMTFEILRVLRARGTVLHCIVNWWDNSRIVAEAEAIGASWSTGYYFHKFTLRIRGVRMLMQLFIDAASTSAGLLRDALAFRASHVLVSDYVTVVRNAPTLALLRLFGRRVILRLGNAPDPGPRYRWVWRYAVSPFVDQFVCNSPFTDRELAAHGIRERKRVTIGHTPPTRRDTREPRGRDLRRVVYVGQIIPQKGLAILLDAIGVLVGRGHDVRLDVAGRIDGWVPPEYEPYRTDVLARAARPDLNGRVRFLGYRDDVPAVLGEAAIHCCPSVREIREGFGVVVIEAKRAGIPSVVFPSGNLPNLIQHGADGWICRDETAEALAEGIEYFLDPVRLRAGMAAARASSRAYSRERFEASWTTVFAGSA